MTAISAGESLDVDSIAGVDSTGQIGAVLALPEHLRDALARVDASGASPVDAPGGVIVAGMGGSAVGARLASGALGAKLTRPLLVSDDYTLPGWAGPGTLVLCSSYSGATEETLAAYDEAGARGAPRLVATTGGPLLERSRRDGVPVILLPVGLQPRAAMAYSLVAALHAAALAGAAPSVRAEIERAATLAEELLAGWGPDAADGNEAKAIARRLHGTLPIVVGSALSAPVAYRWKCQFNENTGIPAFCSTLPEADHNEVVGWEAAASLGRMSYVSLEDTGAHPRNALRAELTAALAEPGASTILRVRARGVTPVERLVSLVLLGDLVSIYAAVLRGTDPVDIHNIHTLKAQLSRAS
jgi:glucose/mannose-6-phosphate isomerase